MNELQKFFRHYRALAVVATVLLSTACASGTAERSSQPLIDEPSDARILFESARDVFSETGIDVALAADEAMVLTSTWDQVHKELKHRLIVRVIEVHGGRGVALNITSEYLRRTRIDGEEFWTPPEDRLTKERAKNDEMELGQAIKARYDERRE